MDDNSQNHLKLSQDEIVALVVSDTHDDIEGIHAIHKQLERKKLNVDIVLCPGDLTTMPNKDWKKPPDPKEVSTFDTKAEKIISALDKIPTRSGRVFWVPGNHDPLTYFKNHRSMANNVHGRVVQIAPGLMVGGWGGCVEARENGKDVWGAYPSPDFQVDKDVEILEKAVAENVQAGKSSLVLITHSGPDGSSTAEVTGTDPNYLQKPGLRTHVINSGSKALARVVRSQIVQKTCILNLHGHTHQGMGLARLGGVPILNPGSTLHGGSFSIVTLRRREEEDYDVDDEKGDENSGGKSHPETETASRGANGPWYVAETRLLSFKRTRAERRYAGSINKPNDS